MKEFNGWLKFWTQAKMEAQISPNGDNKWDFNSLVFDIIWKLDLSKNCSRFCTWVFCTIQTRSQEFFLRRVSLRASPSPYHSPLPFNTRGAAQLPHAGYGSVSIRGDNHIQRNMSSSNFNIWLIDFLLKRVPQSCRILYFIQYKILLNFFLAEMRKIISFLKRNPLKSHNFCEGHFPNTKIHVFMFRQSIQYTIRGRYMYLIYIIILLRTKMHFKNTK